MKSSPTSLYIAVPRYGHEVRVCKVRNGYDEQFTQLSLSHSSAE
jgi:hypothetical protein